MSGAVSFGFGAVVGSVLSGFAGWKLAAAFLPLSDHQALAVGNLYSSWLLVLCCGAILVRTILR